MILQGRWERNTFSAEESMTDGMIKSTLKSTLDHFEKWIGIIKVNGRFCSDENRQLADEETPKTACGNCGYIC